MQRNPHATIPKLIEKGLRAVLGMQSFITGQLDIEIGFYPNSTLCYAPATTDKVYKDYIVIPTCQSTTQKLADALEKLDLAQLEMHLESAMDGIAKLVNDPEPGRQLSWPERYASGRSKARYQGRPSGGSAGKRHEKDRQ